jgi:hypothetical protein
MTEFSAAEWISIITAVGTVITGIIAAIKATNASRVATKNQDRLEGLVTDSSEIKARAFTIESNTNGNITDLRLEIRKAKQINEHLLEVITCLVDQLPPGSLMRAMKEIDKLRAEIGLRRVGDLHFESDFSKSNLEDNNATETHKEG